MARPLYRLSAACLAWLSVAGLAAGFHLDLFDLSDPAFPQITPGPSAAALDLRLRNDLAPRAVMSCATSCIYSAVTKSTTCRLNDLTCECQSLNADVIYAAAYMCVANACGYLVAANIFSAASDVCLSIEAGLTTFTDFGAYTDDSSTTDTDPTTAVVVVTRTNAAGSVITSTAYVVGSSPTGSSGGSGNGGGGDSGLSKTATIGIAVGSAGGAVILCALLFVIYKCCARRDRQQTYAPVVPVPPETDSVSHPLPATAAVGIPASKSELAGESKVYAVLPTGNAPSPVSQSDVSRQPSIMSTATTTVSGTAVSPVQGYAPAYNPPRPPFQAVPPAHEMQASPVPGFVPGYMQPPVVPTHAHSGYGQPAQPMLYAHTPGVRPEVMRDTQMRTELHGEAYGSGMYEMSATPTPMR